MSSFLVRVLFIYWETSLFSIGLVHLFYFETHLIEVHWILYLQYRERVIFIGDHIDEEFSNQILATMLYLDSIDDSKKLYMYINGPGGDVSSSFAARPLNLFIIFKCIYKSTCFFLLFFSLSFSFSVLWLISIFIAAYS